MEGRGARVPAGRRLAAFAGAVALVSAAMATVAGAAPLVDVCKGNWDPVLRDVTVNQGLGTQSVLTRGKAALVRLFLSAPSCAPPLSVRLVSATINATGGGTSSVDVPTTPAQLGPNYPVLDSYGSAPTPDGPGNPVFRIPALGATASTTGAYPVAFAAKVTYEYQAVVGSWTRKTIDVVSMPGSTAPITATVSPVPNALRVLVVPMGDASAPMSEQFPEASNGGTPADGQYADTAVQKGMQTLSRLLPVPDGVGDLTSTTGGLRYRLIDSSMIDLGPNGLDLMANGVFCGKSSNFSLPSDGPNLASQLAAFLNDWNRANSSAQADRVVGVVWYAKSSGVEAGCAEGMAAVGGRTAWVRAFPDTMVGTSPNPSMTGALLGMELAHTFGSVRPDDSRNIYGDYHSRNTSADPTNTKRAYDLSLAKWLATPASVMKYTGTSSGQSVSSWNNTTALMEAEDYAFSQCVLTPGMSAAACPWGPAGSVGTAKAGDAFVLSGTLDGTTADLHTYRTGPFEETAPDPTGEYRLVQRDAAGDILLTASGDRSVGLPARAVETVHTDAADGPHSHEDGIATLAAAVPAQAVAQAFEVWRGEPPSGAPACTPNSMPAGCVYARLAASPPVVTNWANGTVVTSIADFTPAAGDQVDGEISPDGRHVAWASGDRIFVQRRDATTNQPVGAPSAALTGAEPAWSADGDRLSFVNGGDVVVVDIDTDAEPPTFGSRRVLYNHLLQTPPPLGSTLASHPAFSPDGRYVAVAINRGIWRIDGGAATNSVVCDLARLTATTTCRPLATDGDNAEPSWGGTGGVAGAGLVAYRKGADVWTLDPDAGNGYAQTRRIADASAPAWGGNVLAFVTGGNVAAADTTVVAADGAYPSITHLTAGGSDARPSLSADAGVLAFDRDTGPANARDVMVATLGSSNPRIYFRATTPDDPHLLRGDVFLSCGAGYEPLFADLRPVSTSTSPSGNSAEFETYYDDSRACPGGTIYAQVTNGYSSSPMTAIRTIPPATPGPGPGRGAPLTAISAPTPGSVFLQYDPVIAIGSSIDRTGGTNPGDVALEWRLTGPAGSGWNGSVVGSGQRLEFDAPVPGGWTPGNYTLTVTATNEAGSTTSAVTYRILSDPGHLGRNVTVSFSPQTLYIPSAGNDVTVVITPQEQRLRDVDPKTVRITQVGNVATSLATTAKGWSANGDGSYTAKFSRQALTCAIAGAGYTGSYVPIVVSGAAPTFEIRGFDPEYPLTAPAETPAAC